MGLLAEVTRKITDSMQLMTQSVESISTAVKEVANNSDKNLHDTQELAQKIETFDL
jgi:methyl-accepting chemotaxis protein